MASSLPPKIQIAMRVSLREMELMRACLETGTHYLDMAAAGPRDVVGSADLDEEFALDAEFKKRGLTALVCFGVDPGASDVFARTLYDPLDTVERLTVFDGDNATADGYAFAPVFSPTTMIEECLMLPPIALENGQRILRKPLSQSMEFEFPAPIGKLHGSACVGTLAEGSLGDKPVWRFMYQITSHDEAFEKYGVQGTGLQTGVPAACAAIMFAKGLIRERGILAPECIDPQPFLDLMTRHGMRWQVIDLPPVG